MERVKVAITGVNGFVGSHLAEHLSNTGVDVIGIGQNEEPSKKTLKFLSDYYSCNLTETWPNIQHVDAIVNLAGLSAVGKSFKEPQNYLNTNTSIITNLCESYLDKDYSPRIIIVSSGSVYSGNQQIPISEAGIIKPTSPYSLSKLMNEDQAIYYRNRGLDCVIARPFNHIGPGQKEGFIIPDLCKKIEELQPNQSEIIVGNLETKRDYTDVRDIVRAYGKLALQDILEYDTYNICSSESLSGLQILDMIKKSLNRQDITYQVDPNLIRPNDIKDITGDYNRLKEETGWSPSIGISQTIEDFIASKKL